jgi:hypothetical protein
VLPRFQGPHQTAEPRPPNGSISLHHPCTQSSPSSQQGKLSLAPSFDYVPHRSHRPRLSNPPQSAAGQVVPQYRCCKRRPPTQSYAALATPAAAVRCKRPKPTPMPQSLAASITLVATTWVRQPPSSLPPVPAALPRHRQKPSMTDGNTSNTTIENNYLNLI